MFNTWTNCTEEYMKLKYTAQNAGIWNNEWNLTVTSKNIYMQDPKHILLFYNPAKNKNLKCKIVPKSNKQKKNKKKKKGLLCKKSTPPATVQFINWYLMLFSCHYYFFVKKKGII